MNSVYLLEADTPKSFIFTSGILGDQRAAAKELPGSSSKTIRSAVAASEPLARRVGKAPRARFRGPLRRRGAPPPRPASLSTRLVSDFFESKIC